MTDCVNAGRTTECATVLVVSYGHVRYKRDTARSYRTLSSFYLRLLLCLGAEVRMLKRHPRGSGNARLSREARRVRSDFLDFGKEESQR